jgi:hypothetical protein
LALRKRRACKKNEIFPVDIGERRKTAAEAILPEFFAIFFYFGATTMSESREKLDFFLSHKRNEKGPADSFVSRPFFLPI